MFKYVWDMGEFPEPQRKSAAARENWDIGPSKEGPIMLAIKSSQIFTFMHLYIHLIVSTWAYSLGCIYLVAFNWVHSLRCIYLGALFRYVWDMLKYVWDMGEFPDI